MSERSVQEEAVFQLKVKQQIRVLELRAQLRRLASMGAYSHEVMPIMAEFWRVEDEISQ